MIQATCHRRIDRPRAIIFDWDNTLVDSWTILHDAINVALDAFGLAPWTLEQTRKRVRNSLRDSFPSLFGEHAKEAEKLFYDRFAAIHLDALRPCPGAGRMLEDLDEAGLYLGVVSNKKGDSYAGKRPIWVGTDTSGRSLVPLTPRVTSPLSSPSIWPWPVVGSAVANRCGSSAMPTSTWNAQPTPIASRSWCGNNRRDRGNSTLSPRHGILWSAKSFPSLSGDCKLKILPVWFQRLIQGRDPRKPGINRLRGVAPGPQRRR